MDWRAINKILGNIDLYWLDFILKGHLPDNAKLLDAGCGEGRNLYYCMQNGYDVFGVDQNPEAIRYIKIIANQLKLDNVDARFQTMNLAKLLFPDETFDVIINSAVLHFAEDRDHFLKMLGECVRVLKPGGKMFIRTMTNKGLTHEQNLPNKNEDRFLLDDELLEHFCKIYCLEFLETPKNVIVGNVRTMGTYTFTKIKNG